MRHLPLSIICIAAILAGCNHDTAGPTSTPATPAGVAATVNGDTIKLSDFYDHMGMKQTAQIETGKGISQVRVVGSFGLQALQELVDQRILMQMAKDASLVPTEAEIDAELNFETDLRPDYVTVLQQQGLTMEMIRNELAVGLAREHLTMKGVVVTPAEVDDYIKKNPQTFSDPATAKVLFIQVSSKQIQAKVDAELTSGRSFGSVAAQYSEAAQAKETGGAFPTDQIAQMPTKLQALVAKTAANTKTEWVVDGKNFLRFFVVSKTAERSHAPTGPQKELIRRGIAIKRGEQQNGFNRLFAEKIQSAKIDVSIPYLKEAWAKAASRISVSPSSK